MTEDPRISEIRAVLDACGDGDGCRCPTRIRAILDRQPVREEPQHDFRIGQRIEFRQWVGGYVLSVNPLRVRSDYTDNPTTNPREIRPEDEDDPLTQEPLSDSSLPAPRVFFPGDTVPAGREVANRNADVYRWDRDRLVLSYEGPLVEVRKLSPEEWQAAVDRARAERADVEWQHTEGTNP